MANAALLVFPDGMGAQDVEQALRTAGVDVTRVADPLQAASQVVRAPPPVVLFHGSVRAMPLGRACAELRKLRPDIKVLQLAGTLSGVGLPPDVSVVMADSPRAIARIVLEALGAPPPEQWSYTTVRELGQDGVFESSVVIVPGMESPVRLSIVREGFQEHNTTFAHAAATIGRVVHPALPRVIRSGPLDGRAMVMSAYDEGCSLGAIARLRAAPPSMNAVQFLLGECVSALGALHAAHVRHGMVRPHAIHIRDDGSLSLLYAGIGALAEDDRLAVRKGIGVPRRMDDVAPEQLKQTARGLFTDVYQLGYTFYALVTGTAPLNRDDMMATLRAVTTEKAPCPPGALGPLLCAMLDKDPTRRPAIADIAQAVTTERQTLWQRLMSRGDGGAARKELAGLVARTRAAGLG